MDWKLVPRDAAGKALASSAGVNVNRVSAEAIAVKVCMHKKCTVDVNVTLKRSHAKSVY